MSFLISKFFIFLIKPLTWVLILLGFSLFLRKKRLKQRMLVSAVFLVLVFSNTWLFNQFAKLSEAPYPVLKHYDVGILLGGFSSINTNQQIAFTSAADRILQTILLYRQGVIKKILISSGSANLFEQGVKEADLAADYLRQIGIPDSAIIVESQSRNTKENIQYSFAIIDEKHLGDGLLIVTSAWHLPRAKLIVQQQEKYKPDFYPTHHLSTTDLSWDDYIIPNVETLNNWGVLIKEWVGYFATLVRLT